MNPKITAYFLAAGSFMFAASLAGKAFFLTTLGHSVVYEWGCGIFMAVVLAIGFFLAFYGLVTQTTKRKQFFGLHLVSLMMFCWILGLYFFAYVVMTKIYYLPDEIPSVLPKLIENARIAGSEEKRQKMARNAYEVYGVNLAYRRESGEFVYYEPTEQDIAFHNKLEQDSSRNQELRESILKGQLKQFPYLFAFFIGAFFLTFFIGSFWITFKKPSDEANPQS
jgi:hypothetical protein